MIKMADIFLNGDTEPRLITVLIEVQHKSAHLD